MSDKLERDEYAELSIPDKLTYIGQHTLASIYTELEIQKEIIRAQYASAEDRTALFEYRKSVRSINDQLNKIREVAAKGY